MSKGNAGGDLRRFYMIFAVIALVGIGAVGYSVGTQAMGKAAMEPVDLEGIDDLRHLTSLAVPVTEGSDEAPVTVIVFGDYLCNHCAAFSLRERPLLEENYVQTGKVRMVYYDFPLDPSPEAGRFLAARAARCAGDQGRFWEYHEQLYRSQLTWGVEADKIGTFMDYAESLGLDVGTFRSCLYSDAHAEAVTANYELAHALGLSGTPAVLVGTGTGMSRRLPSYYYEVIQEAVEATLNGG